MLKEIIKRDGTTEPFIPSKLNKWGEWAADILGDRIDWSSVVLETVRDLGESVYSQDLQAKLIESCVMRRDWAHNVMAGRLEVAILRKKKFDNKIPTVKEMQTKLLDLGLMRKLNYTDQEYEMIEAMIDHDYDFNYAHFQIKQLVNKYSIQNRTEGTSYETPQFIFMRMAMALAEDEPVDIRMAEVYGFYEVFQKGWVNPPTPNFINLGTDHNGLASCCLYTVNDNAKSLAIGDFIAYTMTYMSAGIGSHLNVRSLGDPVRNGLLEHQGKLPYFRSLAGAVKANLQAGRGGACTAYYSCFDPEAHVITMLQNPRTPKEKQNRDIHFAIQFNRLFAKKVASNKDIFTFNVKTAPDLTAKFFSGDQDGFEELYEKYEKDSQFAKNYVSARDLLILSSRQSFDVSTLYAAFMDELNRHTPFKDTIYSSNLCLEIAEPTKAYENMTDLFLEEDHGRGEVALCSLAALNHSALENDEDMEKAAYYALKMIDKTIHQSHYELPHIGFTAKKRLNAGVGIIGLAHYLAKRGLKYDTKEGRDEMHRVAERHAYFVIKASLRLGKELGVAPWMHKTKWPDGWLPIDTYKKTVDELASPNYQYDWETLRQDIVANGGIRNSCVIAHMPTESSSKATGAPNGLYPIRDFHLKKSDQSNIIDWCPTDGDILSNAYQIAWDINSVDLIKAYAIFQKFTDQTISADLYKDRTKRIEITTSEMVNEFLTMAKFGVKTRYYQNTLTSEVDEEGESVFIDSGSEERGCAGGSCTI